ncbi:MAG: hypothetical protein ACD_61C00219G0002 [uncultured bacterium]|nr:MAG: hypothetical protein ACD_61C00219G0002 [uncultured bacterium]
MEKIHRGGPERFTFSGQGTVYSFTVIYEAPAGFEQFVPYVVALIKLEEGPMITAQITDTDLDKIYIGMPVEMVTRLLSEEGDRGLRHYGYKFRSPIIRQ